MLQSALGFVAEPEAAGSRRNRTAAAAAEEECFDLPARLMRALLAGAENGEGDSRCTRREPPVPVDSAYIRVDLPTGEPWLLLSVVDTWPLSAVEVLYAEYLIWRALNPCADGLGAFQRNATARGLARRRAERHSAEAAETHRRYVESGANVAV